MFVSPVCKSTDAILFLAMLKIHKDNFPLIEVVFVSVIPTFIIATELYIFHIVHHTFWSILPFIVWLALVGYIIRLRKITARQLGFNSNKLNGLALHVAVTVAGLVVAYGLALVLHRHLKSNSLTGIHFQFGFLLTAFVQEVIFRGYVMTILESRYSKNVVLMASAILFSQVHAPFPPLLLSVFLTFTGGIVWGWLFMRFRNIYLLTVSHAILNFVFVMLGLISVPSIKF